MTFLIDAGLNVVEVVTDAHPPIGELLSMLILKNGCARLIRNQINSSSSHRFLDGVTKSQTGRHA